MKSNLQIIVVGIFIFFIIVGVVIFAAFGSSNTAKTGSERVVIWGTYPKYLIDGAADQININNPGSLLFTYEEFAPENISLALAEAISERRGPDMILIPQYLLLKEERKLLGIPFASYSEREFKDNFIEAGEVFLTAEGTLAFPFAVDPLVLYWNRDLFTKASLTKAPLLWQEATGNSVKMTEKTEDKSIIRSGIAMGEYQNIPNAKEIISTLAMQAGSPIVRRGSNGLIPVIRSSDFGENINPFELALSFFTQFADPTRSVYSWNRSLPNAKTFFLRGNLAMYVGFASELSSIKETNPNLNFDVALIPQAQSGARYVTFANVYGLSVLSSSPYQSASLNMLAQLTGPVFQQNLSEKTSLPPVRKDLLQTLPGTAAGDVFWNSALISKSWLDPDYNRTSSLVRTMIESINTGAGAVDEAVNYFAASMNEIFQY